MPCYTEPLSLRLPHSPPPTRPLFTSFLKFSHLQLSPLYQTPPFVSLLHPPAAPNLHVIPELAAPTLRVRNPNPNPLRQGNGNPNPNPTSNPPGSVPMHTPLPHIGMPFCFPVHLPCRLLMTLPLPPNADNTMVPFLTILLFPHLSFSCQPCSC